MKKKTPKPGFMIWQKDSDKMIFLNGYNEPTVKNPYLTEKSKAIFALGQWARTGMQFNAK